MIPAFATTLILVAFVPLNSIVRQLRQETAEAADLRRLTRPLPEARERLAFPLPVTPMDLPGRWETGGRHRVGVAVGTVAQQARWNTPTGQFWAIVDFNALDEPCSHCVAPEDGERAHVGCPGCACPCGTALPDGVEGHAIAGGTRHVG